MTKKDLLSSGPVPPEKEKESGQLPELDLTRTEQEPEEEETSEDEGSVEKPKTADFLLRESDRLKAKVYDLENKNKYLERKLEAAQEEKKKPGITAFDHDGNQERRKRPNTWGLSDLIMPPFTKGRVAIYRICGSEEINPATGLKVEPVDSMIPGRYIIYDKFDPNPLARNKTVQNITGTERVIENGKQVVKEVVEDIIFHRGFLQVPVDSSYPLHVFIELHPNNKNNKHRPHNAPIIFERVDIDFRSAASQGAALELSVDAGVEVKNMTKEDVLSYAASVPEISTAAGRPIHEIRTDLMRWAMNNPIPYYKLNKNAKAAIQINVLDALNFGLISYRMDKKGYLDMETEEVICVHTPAEEPMAKLVKFLATENGKPWYENLLKRMNYWSND